ncbi:GL14689 [Drosophila persimilis]|uniref:GL14689 n=1 Tax=Drosophila persimilis TaxID=7234 RepID=B4GVN9_DROPE|nr:GL14689 [Drosophila persimilis]
MMRPLLQSLRLPPLELLLMTVRMPLRRQLKSQNTDTSSSRGRARQSNSLTSEGEMEMEMYPQLLPAVSTSQHILYLSSGPLPNENVIDFNWGPDQQQQQQQEDTKSGSRDQRPATSRDWTKPIRDEGNGDGGGEGEGEGSWAAGFFTQQQQHHLQHQLTFCSPLNARAVLELELELRLELELELEFVIVKLILLARSLGLVYVYVSGERFVDLFLAACCM